MGRLLMAVAFTLLVLLPVIGCQSSLPSTLDENSVRAYADPATEMTLQGLSENDLAKYIQYGNSEFKAAVTQEILDEATAQIGDQLGAYETKEFLRIEERGGYILVHYRAKYEKGEVGIRMVFDQDHLVAGQWFE
jgi:hypothetical protein